MVTLIALYSNDGCVGRCDAKCYEAESGPCDCICGGVNHGAGRARAEAQTRTHAERMIEAFARANGLEKYQVDLSAAGMRGTLF